MRYQAEDGTIVDEKYYRACEGRKRTMRIGTIGSGSIVKSLLDGIQITEGISCEAVYSRSQEKGEALAAGYGVEKVYTSLNDLMKDEKVDFIYVASPNNLHYEQAKMALEHGKNVICEKPFTTTLEKTKELIRLAKEKGLFLFDAVPPSFLPNFFEVKKAMPKIGKLKLVMSNYSQYSSRYDALLQGDLPNVFNKAFAGGCIQDIGFYNLYFNIAMFGKPQNAVYYANMYPGQVDTSGVLVMQYDGFVSSNTCAKDTWGINYVQIEGEKGYIYIKGGCNALTEIKVVTKEGEETINLQKPVSRWLYEVQEIAKIVQNKDYEECWRRLDVTMDVMEVLEKVRKAAGIYFTDEE